ncbi:hypothetical protein [Rathayibacter tritici]|uniref:hypothetical protein n=1 Tax=Rathayibacter tritici TaxID=33888 RepID=UPI0008375AE9|nr:hypothetical protein [Rathayibacter tritici]PPI45585.1 hypothetical protein C5D18_05920 [Rathayibacter tritici]
MTGGSQKRPWDALVEIGEWISFSGGGRASGEPGLRFAANCFVPGGEEGPDVDIVSIVLERASRDMTVWEARFLAPALAMRSIEISQRIVVTEAIKPVALGVVIAVRP